mgnify:CR=1 FL=1
MATRTIPTALATFDDRPDSGLIDVKVVAGVFSCSTNTVWRRFGRLAIKVSPQQTRWRVGDIRKELAALTNRAAA